MKNHQTARPRTLALLLAATVLPVTPILAQEAVTAPPPVAATVPPPEAAATPPAAATAAPPAPAPVFAPRSEVVQPLPVRAAPPPEPVATERAPRTTVARVARPAPQPRVVVAPVVAATVAAAPTPSIAPEPAAPVTPPVVTNVPESSPDVISASSTSTSVTDRTPWLWIVGGLLALSALVAFLFARRSRRPAEGIAYDEPVYAAPPVVAAPRLDPVLAAPAVASVADDERPWIGLSLQPTRASSREGNDLVEYDLIVENAGEVLANDVRVSTFLIDGRTPSTETETSLIEPVGETQSCFIDLAPGISVPIASTLSVPHGVQPWIIAEARYPLPGGREGHIAARFALESTSDDTVEARLDDVLERV